MSHKVFIEDNKEITVKNLFKDYQNKHNRKDLKDASILELESMIEALYEVNETSINHAKEIASDRNPIRKKRGESILSEEYIWPWNNFVDDYGNRMIPFNYEIESILKYLVYLHENRYTPKQIAAIFVDELGDMQNPSNAFILTYISKFSNLTKPSFYDYVMNELNKRRTTPGNNITEKLKEALLSKGIKEEEAEILSEARIGKLYENGHETAEVLIFPNGNREGIDCHGNWIYMNELASHDNHLAIIFKSRNDKVSRYLVNNEEKKALITNEKGTTNDKVSYTYRIELMPYKSIEDLTTQIESIITDIAILDISHDKAYELAREMQELMTASEDTNNLLCEDILNEGINELKKNYV